MKYYVPFLEGYVAILSGMLLEVCRILNPKLLNPKPSTLQTPKSESGLGVLYLVRVHVTVNADPLRRFASGSNCLGSAEDIETLDSAPYCPARITPFIQNIPKPQNIKPA